MVERQQDWADAEGIGGQILWLIPNLFLQAPELTVLITHLSAGRSWQNTMRSPSTCFGSRKISN